MGTKGVGSLGLALAVVAVDQATKLWVAGTLALGASRAIWEPVIALTRFHNRGAAFGLFPEQTWAFALVSAVVVGFLTGVLVAERWSARLLRVGGALLLGGAIGNLVDRLRWGYVLDFVEIRGFPVFNVADAGIVVGAALIVVSFLLGRTR